MHVKLKERRVNFMSQTRHIEAKLVTFSSENEDKFVPQIGNSLSVQ